MENWETSSVHITSLSSSLNYLFEEVFVDPDVIFSITSHIGVH